MTVWSRRSVQSRWVKNESMVGLERGVFVPVLIDDIEPPVAFKTTQAADLRRWSRSSSLPAELLEAIHAVVDA